MQLKSMCTHTDTHTLFRDNSWAHMTRFWTHTHTHTHTLFRVNVSGHIQPHACAYISACAHTHTRTHTQTHSHTHIQVPNAKKDPDRAEQLLQQAMGESHIYVSCGTSHMKVSTAKSPAQNISYTSMYIHIYICIYTYIHTNVHTITVTEFGQGNSFISHVCAYGHTHFNACVNIYIYIHTHIHIHIHYIYIYIYTHRCNAGEASSVERGGRQQDTAVR